MPGADDLTITLLVNADYATDGKLAEGVIAMLSDLGAKVRLNCLTGKNFDNAREGGKYDWLVLCNGGEPITMLQNTGRLAPIVPTTTHSHRANGAGELGLLPLDQEMATTINAFLGERDPAKRTELAKVYQKLYTKNLSGIGLTAYRGALIVKKRFSNIPLETPICMFNRAEDNIFRERVLVATDKQIDVELHANMLPGAPGDAGQCFNRSFDGCCEPIPRRTWSE